LGGGGQTPEDALTALNVIFLRKEVAVRVEGGAAIRDPDDTTIVEADYLLIRRCQRGYDAFIFGGKLVIRATTDFSHQLARAPRTNSLPQIAFGVFALSILPLPPSRLR
jgi:hypothetical protein